MMSETAFFVKDIVGPKGSVSLVPEEEARSEADALSGSADIDKHTKTDAIRLHHAAVGPDKHFLKPDEVFSMEDEPGHQELCDREQAFFLKAIREDLDLTGVDGCGGQLAPDRAGRRAEHRGGAGHPARLGHDRHRQALPHRRRRRTGSLVVEG
jgi:hypothetical protein